MRREFLDHRSLKANYSRKHDQECPLDHRFVFFLNFIFTCQVMPYSIQIALIKLSALEVKMTSAVKYARKLIVPDVQ